MIGIVTDSTADLPVAYFEENNVAMVPLRVRFGAQEYRDWLDIEPESFYVKLAAADELPKTSQPTPEDFVAVYQALGAKFEAIISLHISSKLSGTWASAKMAAQRSDVPVYVIDTGLASVALGMVVDEVVKARSTAKNVTQLVKVAEAASQSSEVFFVVETLRYLEMGGRIGKARALAGSVLKIRPVLTLKEGQVSVAGKARGGLQAIALAGEKAASVASRMARPRVVLAHAKAAEGCEALRAELLRQGVDAQSAQSDWIGAVIGTYIGPGGFAVGVCESQT